jgi:tape measure domain-containing protein
MMNLAQLNVTIGADIEAFEKAVKELEKGVGKLGEKLKDAGETLSTYVTLPLAALGVASLKVAGDFEALQKGLSAVMGSSEEAAKEFERLKEVAKLPGLGLEEAVQGSINLQAVGFAAEQSREILKGFGNALATVGKGKADLEGVITALSQMASKGKISAEEINQIAERVPQIRKVMKDAFGTADTEELQKMGISVDQFVAKATEELRKLPPVAGGINNAFENVSDGIKLSLKAVGDAINKNFNIEGLLNKVGDTIAELTAKFEALSPTTQKIIIGIAALVAGIGPLLLAIGGIISMVPVVVAGAGAMGSAFTVMLGPIGLIAAGVAAAVYLIWKNWDSIVNYFTNGPGAKVWRSLQSLIDTTMQAITDIFSTHGGWISDIWNGVWDVLVQQTKNIFDVISSIISTALDIIAGFVLIWEGIFTGNWSQVWEGVKTVFKTAVNGLLDLLGSLVSGSLKLFAELASAVGADKVAATFSRAAYFVNQFADSLKFDLGKGKEEIEKVTKAAEETAEALTKTTEKVKEAAREFANMGKNTGFQAINIPPVTIPVAVKMESAMMQAAQEASAQLGQAFVMAEKQATLFGNSFDQLGAKAQALQTYINQLISAGFSPFSTEVQGAITQLNALQAKSIEVGSAVASVLASSFQLLGESIYQSISGNMDSLQGFFNGILMIVADFASQFGQQLIAIGVGQIALSAMAGPAAIAAGAALVALAGVAKAAFSKGPSLSGGGASPAMAGRGGSYSGSQGMTRATQDVGGNVVYTIKGKDLVGTLQRSSTHDNRTK